MKKFAKIWALALSLALALSISLFALSACGEDDGNGGDKKLSFEAADIFGVYELGSDFDLVLDNETTAVLLANTANKQFSGEWSLEENAISATFTEDITPNASAAAAIAEVTEYASIKATVDIADDGRITLQLTSFKYNDTAQSVTEATTPYEPIKNKTEWKDLIGVYTFSSGEMELKLMINESGYFSSTIDKMPFAVHPDGSAHRVLNLPVGSGTITAVASGEGQISDEILSLIPHASTATYYYSDGTTRIIINVNSPESFTIDRTDDTVKLLRIDEHNPMTFVKQ